MQPQIIANRFRFKEIMGDIAHHIIKRFPDMKEAIAGLMADDAEFCALCEDYGACIKAYGYWVQSKKPEAGTRVNEYRDLIQALEAEIEEALLGPLPQQPD